MTAKREDRPDRLDRALARLPRTVASPGFAARVEREVARRGRPRRPLRWRAAAALTAALAAALGLTWHLERRSRVAEQAREIRRQHLELRRELADLRALARETDPLLYLGGDESYDLVFDAGPLLDPRSTGPVLPATFVTPAVAPEE